MVINSEYRHRYHSMNPSIPVAAGTAIELPDVLRLADTDSRLLRKLLLKYGLFLEIVPADRDIPGSYWGDSEAGLIGDRLLVRVDTPLHSVLHEACHYVCMDQARRDGVHTDAGGNYDEENAVCYLQILLADQICLLGRHRMFKDMDSWGYAFRLGSAQCWFENDADDALEWLCHHKLLDAQQTPNWNKRDI